MYHALIHKLQLTLCLILLLLGHITTLSAQNENNQFNNPETVRVGWFNYAYSHKDQQGRRMGYAYDYMQKIAAYTNWKYEYVEDNWPNLLKKLESGEIDILPALSITEERKQKMLFSEDEMGYEEFYILCSPDNEELAARNPSSLNGKRIAVMTGSTVLTSLEEWVKAQQIDCEIVVTPLQKNGLMNLLTTKHVDAVAVIASTTDESHEQLIPFARIGMTHSYFAINKRRPDIKFRIDRAMNHILTLNHYYNVSLHEKYFKHNEIYKYMRHGERRWLKSHGPIRIGYRNNYMPYCAQGKESDEVQGLLKDFIAKAAETFKHDSLIFEPVAYPTINDAIEAVKRGEVDAAFPCRLSPADSEEENLALTDELVTSSEMAVIRSDDNFRTEGNVRVAINASNPTYLSLLREEYNNWEVVVFSSTQECLQGVADNKADLLLISNYRLSVLNDEIDRLKLKAVATGLENRLSFATSMGNRWAYSIINRLTHIMKASEIHTSLALNSNIHKDKTFLDYAKEHYAILFTIMLLIILVFIYLLMRTLKYSRKARAASQAKTQFLFNMSHDIRTPMNAILGYSNLIQENLQDKDKCMDYLHKLHSASDYMLRLIDNVLEMSRIESGKIQLNLKPITIDEIANGIRELCIELFSEKKMQVKYENHMKVKMIEGDIVKINEIFMNLLSNAYKYTPAGGTIGILLEEEKHDKPDHIWVRGTVSDTGIGISEAFLPHLFDEFSREQNYTDSKIKGTGLGMAIVKNLISVMGGTISVESQVGVGTTFVVRIPHRVVKDVQAVEQEDKKPKSDFNGKHILMAEDNELNSEIAIEVLHSLGFIVDTAEDGAVCVQKLEEAPKGTYDLILMDIQMPVMDGYEATRKIRAMADKEKAGIPIVAMTANAFAQDKENAIEAGMNGHIAKPIDIPVLVDTLKEIFKN